MANSWVSTVQNAIDEVTTQMAPKITVPLTIVTGTAITASHGRSRSTRSSDDDQHDQGLDRATEPAGRELDRAELPAAPPPGG